MSRNIGSINLGGGAAAAAVGVNLLNGITGTISIAAGSGASVVASGQTITITTGSLFATFTPTVQGLGSALPQAAWYSVNNKILTMYGSIIVQGSTAATTFIGIPSGMIVTPLFTYLAGNTGHMYPVGSWLSNGQSTTAEMTPVCVDPQTSGATFLVLSRQFASANAQTTAILGNALGASGSIVTWQASVPIV